VVKGLDIFREHFQGHEDKYILIGGTACNLVMDEVGQTFRATKDLDIVLVAEALSPDFGSLFWSFVEAGEYKVREVSSGKRHFYRFANPRDEDYPKMLELFSRIPDVIDRPKGTILTPIPLGAGVASLSAILLDDEYYQWIISGKRTIEGVPTISAEYLIPLKASAWLDLSERSSSGEKIDSNSIKKHKNDVFRLFPILDPEFRPTTPRRLSIDMDRFLRSMATESVDLRNMGVRDRSLGDVLASLRERYSV